MKTFFLLVSLLLGSQAHSYPRLTGEQWNQLADMPPGARNNIDLAPKKYLEVQMADAYLNGVHDTLQGSSVCTGRVKPDEVNADVYHAMRALPAQRLKQPAADLIADILRQKFPCTERRTQ